MPTLTLLLCLLPGPAALDLPLVVNCGPASEERDVDKLELPDRRFRRGSGYGFEGGEGFRRWFSLVRGRPEIELFHSGRVAPEAYHFRLPRGEYVLALGFCESEHHLAGKRVFDVVAQGERIIEALDPFAVAGRDHAFRISRKVVVGTSGRLEILFRPREGEALVNAIWIAPLERQHEAALEAPSGLRCQPGYGLTIVSWDLPGALSPAEFTLERRGLATEDFEPIETRLPVAHFVDHDVELGMSYEYRVRAIDLEGGPGPTSDGVRTSPLSVTRSKLPVYEIRIEQRFLDGMLENVTIDRTARASLRHLGVDYPVNMRLRGASTRHAAKKSYRLEFPKRSPFDGRDVIYLKAEPHDSTMQREKLSCDIFRAIGLPVSETRFVQFLVNGRSQGVYLDIEPIRAPFKQHETLDPDGALFRSQSFDHIADYRPGDLRGADGSPEELEDLIGQLNRVNRGELEHFIREATDWPRVRDYFVAQLLCHRSEIEADDFFYYRHSPDGRWSLIPWDHNNGNLGLLSPHAMAEPFMSLFGQSLQSIGYGPRYWMLLPSRIFHSRALRSDYLERVEELTRELLLSGKVDTFIDANFRAIRSDALRDPMRWPPDSLERFTSSPDRLKRFVREHARRILRQVERARDEKSPALVINEFKLEEKSAWLELRNRGEREIELADYRVSDVEGRGGLGRFPEGARIGPGAYAVYRFGFDPLEEDRPARERDDADREGGRDAFDPEEAERRELEALERRERRRAHFAGFDPRGGSIALLRVQRESARERKRDEGESEREIAIVDWYFYGAQSATYSFGRRADSETEFGFLKPTPGVSNSGETVPAPGLVLDARARWPGRGQCEIELRLSSVCGPRARSATLHYALGEEWKRIALEVDSTGEQRVRLKIPGSERGRRMRYFVVARGEAGIERRAPLVAERNYHAERQERRDED